MPKQDVSSAVAGEATATGTTTDISNLETTTTTDSSLESVAASLDISDEAAQMFANNDPDFAAFANPAKEDTSIEDNSDGEDVAADDDSSGGSETDEPKSDADDTSGDKEVLEFEDDVIPGVTGKDFEALSADAQLAIATFFEDTQAKAKDAEAVQAKLDALMADPVVNSRAAMLDSGVAETQLPVRGISEQEKGVIVNKIMEAIGIDEEEARLCLGVIEGGLNKVVNDAARDLAQSMAGNAMAAQEATRKIAETNKQGNDVMLSLGQFNKSLAVKETDLSNFYKNEGGKFVLNTSHPEAETFKSGLGRVMDWLETQGMGYDGAIKLGAKALYAAAAAALDMPVALNTGERDKKIAADARKAALKPFLKTSAVSGAGSTLNPDGGNVVQKRADAEARIVHGMDAVKLVEDSDYHQAMMVKNFGDPEWSDKILEAAEAGRAIINKRKT
jgi:hypothetical protein